MGGSTATFVNAEGALTAAHTDVGMSVTDRLRWARERGHPRYLWPDVPVAEWRRGLREIERVTAAVTAGRTARLQTGAGLRESALGISAYTAGMGPLLGHWIEAGAVSASVRVEELFRLHLYHARRRAERLQRELKQFGALCEEAGTRTALLKSAHTMVAFFPEPATRPCADLDVFVPRDRIDALAALFSKKGYELAGRQRRPDTWDWRPPQVNTLPQSAEMLHSDDPYTIELHPTLERAVVGMQTVTVSNDPASVFRAAPELNLGPQIDVLRQPELITYLILHLCEDLNQLQLVRVVELQQVVRSEFAQHTQRWQELIALLQSLHAERFGYVALALVERLVPRSVPEFVLVQLRRATPVRLQRWLETRSITDLQQLEKVSLSSRFVWVRGAADAFRTVRYMLWPARARHGSRPVRNVYVERIFRIAAGRVGW